MARPAWRARIIARVSGRRLIRKFNEALDENPGEQFTPRDVVHLMVDLLFAGDHEHLSRQGAVLTVCDPCCGSGYAFFDREVRPHVPDAWIDESKRDPKDGEVGLVGYEINFNRYFYQYTPPRISSPTCASSCYRSSTISHGGSSLMGRGYRGDRGVTEGWGRKDEPGRRFRPYLAYRDSGVEWLGEIPAGWEVKRLWHLTPSSRKIMYGIVLPGPNVDDGVPIVKGGDVSSNHLRLDQLIGRQLIRSGTSVGANYREATRARRSQASKIEG